MDKTTKHIDFTNGHAVSISPVLFRETNTVISFASRAAAEAAVNGAIREGMTAIRLYDMGDKHGT